MAEHLVMLRYTDDAGERFVGLCRPRDSVEQLRRIVGEGDEDDVWCEYSDRSAVILDTSGPLVISDSGSLRGIAFWLGVAAEWLRRREVLEEVDDGFDDL